MSFLDFTLTNYGMIYELIGITILLFVSAHITREIKYRTGCVISMLAAAAATYMIGFDKNDPVVTGIAASDDDASDSSSRAERRDAS